MDISHKKVKELLGLTLLVYEYGKTFTLEKGETVQQFLEKSTTALNDTCMSVLQDFKVCSPLGTVELFISDNDTDIQVGITKSDTNKRITVIFRGSESRSDWYYDLMIKKKHIINDIYVHAGFYHQLHTNNVYERLIDKLHQLVKDYPEYDICITGHSLGAALATLFGYKYALLTEKPICVVSFASPRVGNYYFKQAFEQQSNLCHYRIVNNRDIVTAMPMYRYYHCGKNICLYDTGAVEIKDCEQVNWWRFSVFYCWYISDHSVNLYYDRLIKNIW